RQGQLQASAGPVRGRPGERQAVGGQDRTGGVEHGAQAVDLGMHGGRGNGPRVGAAVAVAPPLAAPSLTVSPTSAPFGISGRRPSGGSDSTTSVSVSVSSATSASSSASMSSEVSGRAGVSSVSGTPSPSPSGTGPSGSWPDWPDPDSAAGSSRG